jgi:hypothetical protein
MVADVGANRCYDAPSSAATIGQAPMAERHDSAPACKGSEHTLPFREYLDGHRFDARTVELMSIAYEMARSAIWLRGANGEVGAHLAGKIMEKVRAGERAPDRLCDAALAHIRSGLNEGV